MSTTKTVIANIAIAHGSKTFKRGERIEDMPALEADALITKGYARLATDEGKPDKPAEKKNQGGAPENKAK